jgi:hypothetical protein
MSSDDAYDEGYYKTSQWLINGGDPQSQPKPSLTLEASQRLDWWRGFQDAIDNDKVMDKEVTILTSWFMILVMALFLVFGVYLLVASNHWLIKIVGAAMIYFSGQILRNHK